MLKVARFGSVWCPGEAIIAERQHLDTAFVHLGERLSSDFELAHETPFCRCLRRDTVFPSFIGGRMGKADCWCDPEFVFVGFQKIE